MEEDRIGADFMPALKSARPLPPQFVSTSVIQERDELRDIKAIYQFQKNSVLLLELFHSLLPPVRHLK